MFVSCTLYPIYLTDVRSISLRGLGRFVKLTPLFVSMLRKKIVWYLISLLVSFFLVLIIVAILFLMNDATLIDYFDRLPQMILRFLASPLFWLLISTPYLITKLIHYWKRGYKNGGFRKFGVRFSYSFVFPGIAIVSLIKLSSWYQMSENFDYSWEQDAFNKQGLSQRYSASDEKIRGMHVFGMRALDSLEIRKLASGNIEHVVLVPYADQEDYNTPMEKLSPTRLARRESSYASIIKLAHEMGSEVIIKPHVWLGNPSDGKWRADIWMDSEEDWIEWETNYTEFILTNAKMSERFKLPLFCIGNEYYLSTTKRPEYWRSLIKKVRAVYSGKLVYGANWDREYKEIEFWDELDYIGIQAYFPLVDHKDPEYDKIVSGWDTHIKEIEKVSKKYGRKVLFTELGYKSTPDAAQYPWLWEDFMNNQLQRISNKTQVYCYQAFFEKVWVQKWFAGAMIWQWHAHDDGEKANHYFTPKGKPAFNEIAKGFKLD